MIQSNTLRMPFAEWLGKMADDGLDLAARTLAMHAAAFDLEGNEQIKTLLGISADNTLRRIKAILVKGGWVIIGRQTGGRGHGIIVIPAYRETPVTFTDLSAKNPLKYCTIFGEQTPSGDATPLQETPSRKPPVSGVGVSAKNPIKPAFLVESPSISEGYYPLAPARATKEYPTDINNTKGERDTPHMNGKGFIISAKHDVYVPLEHVERWRAKYTALPDLEATMTNLGALILNKGHMHTGWNCPEGWMPKILAEENQKAADRAAESAARQKRAAAAYGAAQNGPKETSQAIRELQALAGKRS